MAAQNNDTLEIQVDNVTSDSEQVVQLFYHKFHSWFKNIGKDSVKSEIDDAYMVNNFIMFSEDGLLMKDLDFHSVESCEKQILKDLPSEKISIGKHKWIYVYMESHVNKRELISILEFLKKQQIDYKFGLEDEIVPKFLKK